MSALQDFAEQIEIYGVPYYQQRTQNTKYLIKAFTIDKDTLGVIVYDNNGNVVEARFNQNLNL